MGNTALELQDGGRSLQRRSATGGRIDVASAQHISSPTLVFDEVLGEWISVEEAALLGRIDEGQGVAAASDETDDAARDSAAAAHLTVQALIDWSSQTGVSQLISETSI